MFDSLMRRWGRPRSADAARLASDRDWLAGANAELKSHLGGYLARAEISVLVTRLRQDERRLEPFGFKVYSQSDEDGILEEIFRRLKIERGAFLEVGVDDGLECNSHYLIHKGWCGAWAEADEGRKNAITARFGSILGDRLQTWFGYVTRENINELVSFAGRGMADELDLLSIDVDGNDVYLLAALDARPKVICIEYNSKFPARIFKQQVYDEKRRWGGTDYFGASLAALDAVARGKGYQLVGANLTGVNAFFVRRDLAGDLFCADESVHYLYNPPRYWLLDHYSRIGHPADFGPYTDLT